MHRSSFDYSFSELSPNSGWSGRANSVAVGCPRRYPPRPPLNASVMPTERRLKERKLTAIVLGVNVMLLAGCFGSEVARTTSPSGKVDAVLMEASGGATTSFGYEVFVVPAGKSTWLQKKVAFLYGATRSEQAYGVNLRWAGPANLTLEYLTAEAEDLLFAERFRSR